jgi:hypothetical protein
LVTGFIRSTYNYLFIAKATTQKLFSSGVYMAKETIRAVSAITKQVLWRGRRKL